MLRLASSVGQCQIMRRSVNDVCIEKGAPKVNNSTDRLRECEEIGKRARGSKTQQFSHCHLLMVPKCWFCRDMKLQHLETIF